MNILEIEILTDDLNATESFYSETLGLTLINKNSNSISYLIGHSTLTFIKSNKESPKYHFAFNIPNNKIDEAVLWTVSKCNLISASDGSIITNFENWKAKAIYFYDNNENILEFIARFDLKNLTDKPFDKNSIQSISEIGIVTENPLVFSENIVNSNDLKYFSKGPKSEKFVAVGDDNGLLVISATNRNWFPTENKSKHHYSKIKLLVNGLTKTIINKA